MVSELLDLLVRLTLAASAATVLALLLRHPLRRLAGANAAYQCWLIVPVALLAAALPALRSAPAMVLALAPPAKAAALVSSAKLTSGNSLAWVLLVWVAGALASMALLVLGQRAYVRSLGTLRANDGVLVAANAQQGPALLGLWRPVIVVPSDFATRYNAHEQALIVAHEQQHLLRRDPLANAALALLQCALWFNPLIYIAASRCRFDQELACDAAVMARHGSLRQHYAAAMLKTQSAGAPALATCHWQSSHPLKERIMQLKKTSPGATRRRAGHLIVALFACASVLGTLAARADTAPAGKPAYVLAVEFAPGTQTAGAPVKADEEVAINWKQPGASWSGTFRVLPASDDTVIVKMKITGENGKVTAPTLLMRLGEGGRVESTEPPFKIGITVTRAASGS
ncbi:MAG: M56 family metallopeptidase [Pseudomonadota bacterium]